MIRNELRSFNINVEWQFQKRKFTFFDAWGKSDTHITSSRLFTRTCFSLPYLLLFVPSRSTMRGWVSSVLALSSAFLLWTGYPGQHSLETVARYFCQWRSAWEFELMTSIPRLQLDGLHLCFKLILMFLLTIPISSSDLEPFFCEFLSLCEITL